MTTHWLHGAGLLLVAGCSSGGGGSATPVASSAEAVSAFMRAAADSNLTRMAELWGTASGPADRTQLNDKRLTVLQVYLKGDSTRVLADEPVTGSSNQRRVSIALYRGSCVKQFPVFTVRLGDGGWIVQNVNIELAGNPARPCEP